MTSLIRAEKVIINAPLEKVWQALIDVANYPRWNPFTTRVETDFIVGRPAFLRVVMNPRVRLTPREIVQAFEPPRLIAWGAIVGAPFLLRTSRKQIVEPLDAEHTTYETYETFDGLLAAFTKGLSGHDVQRGFAAMSTALKQYVEAATLHPSP